MAERGRPHEGARVTSMPDHWDYVLAAFGVAAIALAGYWRYLTARARSLGGGHHAGGRRA
jgi:hypothetical protein